MTLMDVLEALYRKYGFYQDALDNFTFKGLDGSDKIKSLVNGLRNDPPAKAGEIEVLEMEDYRSQKMLDAGFPSSNVLRFLMKDGSWVAVRPSGTEPKCKFYFSIVAKNAEEAQSKLKSMRDTFERN